MHQRIVAWLSAGVLAAGVSATTFVGAAIAYANDDSGPNSTTSPSEPAGTDNETTPDAANPNATPDPRTNGTEAAVAEEEAEEKAEEALDIDGDVPEDLAENVPGEEPADELEPSDDETESRLEQERTDGGEEQPEAKDTVASSAITDQTFDIADGTASGITDTIPMAEEDASRTLDAGIEPEPVPEASTLATITRDAPPSPVAARLVMTAADIDEPTPAPSLINVVGSFFWGLLDFFSKLAIGPLVVPPGVPVTAGRSSLQIDCGDGYRAEADWYFPTEGEPDKFIYFQHGFPARAGVYNVTLAELAERNNAVVVAPSITGNIFACDGCFLTTGEPMHAAVAKLFEGDRAALLASAQAAGYEGVLPEKFVIAGHSGGAMLAQGAAGYYWQSAAEEEKENLAGVLLFDTSAQGGGLARALDKLPATVPVLHISAAPNPLNFYGRANEVFAEKRPGQFNGVQLIRGAHSDAFRSSILFGIPQAVVSLALGASTPENVEAVQVLAEGWLTDMYEGRVYDPQTRTGIYGEPGEPGGVLIDIPTDAGVAQGYVLPGPAYQMTLIDLVLGTLVNAPGMFDFSTCAVDPNAPAAQQSDLACSA